MARSRRTHLIDPGTAKEPNGGRSSTLFCRFRGCIGCAGVNRSVVRPRRGQRSWQTADHRFWGGILAVGSRLLQGRRDLLQRFELQAPVRWVIRRNVPGDVLEQLEGPSGMPRDTRRSPFAGLDAGRGQFDQSFQKIRVTTDSSQRMPDSFPGLVGFPVITEIPEIYPPQEGVAIPPSVCRRWLLGWFRSRTTVSGRIAERMRKSTRYVRIGWKHVLRNAAGWGDEHFFVASGEKD